MGRASRGTDMARDELLDGVPRAESISMLMEWSGAKAYMTRAALRELAAELLRISEADPKDCFEVHLSSFFSHWKADDELSSPRARFANGLEPAFDRAQREFWAKEIASGEMEFESAPAQFDITIIHVAAEAVSEESSRPDE